MQVEARHVLPSGEVEWRLRLVTGGRGVDVVLGGQLAAALQCVRSWGRVMLCDHRDSKAGRTVGQYSRHVGLHSMCFSVSRARSIASLHANKYFSDSC